MAAMRAIQDGGHEGNPRWRSSVQKISITVPFNLLKMKLPIWARLSDRLSQFSQRAGSFSSMLFSTLFRSCFNLYMCLYLYLSLNPPAFPATHLICFKIINLHQSTSSLFLPYITVFRELQNFCLATALHEGALWLAGTNGLFLVDRRSPAL